ncbi:MAG: extracellular solute-binding protein [Aquiluna sp.]|nr:extracellular solute-binding protein [Aquiluna sp.]
MKLKRATKFVAASSLLLLVLASCTSASTSSDSTGNDSTTDTGTDATAEVMEPVEIEFYSLAWQEGAIASHEEIVEAFNAQSEYVTVKHVQGDWGAIDQLLTTCFEASNCPDVFHFYDTGLRSYAERGNLVDLEPLMSDDFRASMPESAWATTQFPGTEGVYGAPFLMENRVILANKDIMDAAGVVAATVDDPWTWPEFRAAAAKMTSADVDGAGLSLKGSGGVNGIIKLALSVGGEYVEDSSGSWKTVMGPNELALPKMFHDMIHLDGSMSTDLLGLSGTGVNTLFLQGALGMQISGDYMRSQIVAANPDFDWVVMPAPVGISATQPNSAQTMSIAGGSENSAASMEFIEFALNTENQVKLALGDWLIPTSTAAVESAELTSGDYWDVSLKLAKNLEYAPWQGLATFDQWRGAVTPAWFDYLNGDSSISEFTSIVIELGDPVLAKMN